MQELKRYHPFVISAYFLIWIMMITLWKHPIFHVLTLLISWMFLLEQPPIAFGKHVRWNMIFIVIAGITNPIFQQRGIYVLFTIADIPITLEALFYGFDFGCMLVSLMNFMQIYSLLIHTDQVLYMIQRVSQTAAILCSISMQQIANVKKQYEDICYARSLLITNDRWIEKVKENVHVLSALITWLLETSVDTSLSMRSRGYGIGKRRNYIRYTWRKKDKVLGVFLLGIGINVAYCALTLKFWWYPTFYQQLPWISLLCSMFGLLFMSILPYGLRRKENAIWDATIFE